MRIKKIALQSLFVIAVIGIILYGFQCVRRGNDFWTLHFAAQQALKGENIYARGPAVGVPWRAGPTFIFFVTPLALFPLQIAAHLWFYLKIGMTILLLKFSMDLAMRKDEPRRWLCYIFTILFSLPWLNADFTLGHMNIPVIFLAVSALWFYARERSTISALFLAGAISFKVSPGLLLIYFLARREFSYVIKTMAFLCGLLLLPSIFWGAKNIQYLSDFASTLSAQAIFSEPGNGDIDNYSLPGLWMRMTGILTPEHNNGLSLQLISLSWETAYLTASIIIFALIAGLAIWIWLKRENFVLQASLITAAIPLLSWVTRQAHLVWLVFPFAVLIAFCLRQDIERQSRRGVIVLLSMAVILQSLCQTDLWGYKLAYIFRSYYVLVYSYIAIMAALMAANAETSN